MSFGDEVKWLDDVKVIDLSLCIPGPFANRQLADLGANVIKVEPPSGDRMRRFMSTKEDGASAVYRHINRGKRVYRLDLKLDEDRIILQGLIKHADVLLESYRPGVLQRLGFSRTRLQQINPGLFHCALSGYGRAGKILNGGAACYNIYQTLDNEFISLAALETHFWQRFCESVKQPQWIERQQESLPQKALIAELEEMFSAKPIGHWNRLFDGDDCCYEPVLGPSNLTRHPQIKARHLLDEDGPDYAAHINNARHSTRKNFVEISVAKSLHW